MLFVCTARSNCCEKIFLQRGRQSHNIRHSLRIGIQKKKDEEERRKPRRGRRRRREEGEEGKSRKERKREEQDKLCEKGRQSDNTWESLTTMKWGIREGKDDVGQRESEWGIKKKNKKKERKEEEKREEQVNWLCDKEREADRATILEKV